ncbi:MAG: ComF family protein [Sedimentisphaeraceae bacterium JB056]
MSKQIYRISKAGAEIINYLLWPAVCGVCGDSINESDDGLCRSCWQKLSAALSNDYCPSCGRDISKYGLIGSKCPDCEELKLEFESITRVGRYEGVLRDLILKIKHNEHPKINRLLSYQLSSSIQNSLPIKEIDLFTAVPLHWSRKLSRGYNQSWLLLSNIKKEGFTTGKILRRVRKTMPQPGLSFAQRKKNIKGAFTPKDAKSIQGKTICIIDDIKTTGATLNECSRVLKENGAAKVYAAVIAVANA